MKTGKSLAVALYGTIVFFFLFAYAPAASYATLLAYDTFSYSGTDLDGQNGGGGWNGPWSTLLDRSGSAGPNHLSNDGNSLQYPVPFEAPLTAPIALGSRVRTGGAFGGSQPVREHGAIARSTN